MKLMTRKIGQPTGSWNSNISLAAMYTTSQTSSRVLTLGVLLYLHEYGKRRDLMYVYYGRPISGIGSLDFLAPI